MKIKANKVIFSNKDTFSLDNVLAPVILAGLKKFKNVLVERNNKGKVFGVPSEFCGEEGSDIEQGFKKWLETLDQMIYAFDITNEPDISKYDFKYDLIPENKDSRGRTAYGVSCTNNVEKERYHRDMEDHDLKVDNGLKLFAKHFQDLWW